MNRTFTYKIQKEHENIMVSEYLKLQGYSHQNLVALKKIPESILVNGIWEYVNRKLSQDDILTICLDNLTETNEITPVFYPLSIVFEDEDLLIIDKPANMPIHPSQNNHENTLGNAVTYYYQEKNIPFTFRCVNRLDRDTTGLTIIAKHAVSSNLLSEMVAAKAIKRNYLAIVQGEDLPAEGVIDAGIARVSDSTIKREVNLIHGQTAITHYKKISAKNGLCLVSLWLETGRTHQIRVHMNYINHPLIGDFLYNPDFQFLNRQALHSYQLEFVHPITKEFLVITAPLPDDMKQLFPDCNY